ncbi:cytidylyltransferase domain-containing protein [Timonella sp. A28]|uniref:cytidylyltransferase domain-containing protein n=1 Tax=Timonella sp. A28 TaxID=3442640 RepID=UPI003EBE5667
MTTDTFLDEQVLVVIPARGGSKGIPDKNLQRVGDHTLIARAVATARATPLVSAVVVSTDSERIAAEARTAGAEIVMRPEHLADDLASSESAVLHALESYRADNNAFPAVTVFLQCTSPFLNATHLNEAIRKVGDNTHDVVFSVTADHGFQWTVTNGKPAAVGHSPAQRLRRQDRPPHFRETGSFYVFNTQGFLAAQHRFFGSIGFALVDQQDAIEIDTPEDLALCQLLANMRAHVPHAAPDVSALGIDVDAVVTDFDGVHTNDSALLSTDGSEHVTVSRSDGMGVALLRNHGVPLLILSTEKNPIVSARAKKLGVDVLQGIDDKAAALNAWLSANRLDPQRVAYVGNDINDLPAMALVGWPIAVADARDDVKHAACITLTRRGGHGAVREVCDLVLHAHNRTNSPT